MATSTPHARPVLAHQLGSEVNAQRALRLLRTVFTIAPIAFGLACAGAWVGLSR